MKSKTLIGLLAIAPVAAFAQSNDDAEAVDELVVTAHPLADDGLAQSSDVLQGATLQRALRESIGATVAGRPGVHFADFGNNAGRPYIRGLSGPRVRMMQDRIDTLDVSVTSADHAVTTEAFAAESIEILKGPSTLLYGSGAIGGVVNVVTNRIPHTVPDEPISGRFEARRNNNGDQNTFALALDGGSGQFAWHIDAFDREADEFEIPGFAESAGQRALEEAEEGGEEGEEEEEAFGVLPGSQLEADGIAIGGSFVGDRVTAGISFNTYNGFYGLPGGHIEEGEEEGGEEEEEEGNPVLDLEQQRIDVEFSIADPFAGFSSLSFRAGYNDYEHTEFEPNGEAGTNFENDAYDARVELAYGGDDSKWRGVVGLQLTDREFSAIGEEAFVEPVDTDSQGIFWVGERAFENFDFEIGARLERVEHDSVTGINRDFSAYGFAAGLTAPLAERHSLGVMFDIAGRAPIAEELFSNGPHLATRAFEIGDPDLDEERSFSVVVNYGFQGERWDTAFSVYYNDFSDFIYETATGEVEDGLPVFVFRQDNAEFFGLDLEVGFTVNEWVRVVGMYDTVSADLDIEGNDNVPRLPPSSYGLGIELTQGAFSGDVRYRRVDEQDDIADFELPTDSFYDLSLQLGYQVEVAGNDLNLFLIGRNLTDEEQRHHSSFIKDFAPRPGLTWEAGLRLNF
ncbi:MAG: TonB-dependent receptor [Pseudomonadota bacterium]